MRPLFVVILTSLCSCKKQGPGSVVLNIVDDRGSGIRGVMINAGGRPMVSTGKPIETTFEGAEINLGPGDRHWR